MLADNPVAYYRLDDAAGAVLCDASSHHNDGKYAATVYPSALSAARIARHFAAAG